MGSSPTLAATHKVFLHKNVFFEEVFFYFGRFFLNFLNILEIYPAVSEILGSIQRTGCGKLIFFLRIVPIFSDIKSFGPRVFLKSF